MNKAVPAIEDSQTKRFFHGTRAELKPGDLIKAGNPAGVGEHVGEQDRKSTHVFLTPNLDEAIWDAELAPGEGPGRVYIVEPTGEIGEIGRASCRERV